MRIEQGSRDRRLLPVVILLWMSCLAVHGVFVWWSDRVVAERSSANRPVPGKGTAKTGNRIAVVTAEGRDVFVSSGIVILAGAMLIMMIVIGLAWRIGRICERRGIGRIVVMVCVAAALLGSVATWASDAREWFDAAAVRARDGPGSVTVAARPVEPVMASSRREADCQVEVELAAVGDGKVFARSNAQVRVFASGADCMRLHRGAVYRMTGTLGEAEIGSTPLWLTLDDGDGDDDDGRSGSLTALQERPWFERWRERIQESFFTATEGLSDQGRVLVPGLTMGLLGQDHMNMSRPVDGTYADQLEERFRRAGIMHLMAVSGGHFVIVADLIRRFAARLLLPRQVTAILTAGTMTLMAAMMAPGDSVTRALVMSWMAAAALFLGRRPQALSALCCTAIGTLLVKPSMAWSFGFALSCAAVLGIILMSHPMGNVMSLLLPDMLADALAMTVAAQLSTLPIQVLMEPRLPVWSVPANILVAPVVAFATMAGLAGLAVAWVNVDMGSWCAWLASLGTQVMERVAMWLGGGEHATMPWAGGTAGALALATVEAAGIAMAMLISRWFVPSSADHALPGRPFTRNPRNRIRIWWTDTRRMLSELDTDPEPN